MPCTGYMVVIGCVLWPLHVVNDSVRPHCWQLHLHCWHQHLGGQPNTRGVGHKQQAAFLEAGLVLASMRTMQSVALALPHL